MKTYTYCLVVAFFLCELACFAGTLPIRHSGDFTAIYIYLSKDVAITKSTTTDGDGVTRTRFNTGKAHWFGEPELAELTGDVMDSNFIDTPKRIGMSDDGVWLIIMADTHNSTTQNVSTNVCVVSLSNGEHHFGDTLQDAAKQFKMKPEDLASIKLEPIQVFFDRQLFSRLDKASTN